MQILVSQLREQHEIMTCCLGLVTVKLPNWGQAPSACLLMAGTKETDKMAASWKTALRVSLTFFRSDEALLSDLLDVKYGSWFFLSNPEPSLRLSLVSQRHDTHIADPTNRNRSRETSDNNQHLLKTWRYVFFVYPWIGFHVKFALKSSSITETPGSNCEVI